MAVTQEEFNDYIQTINQVMDWLEQEPTIQERQAESDKFDAAFQDGYNNGYAQARFDYDQEPILDKIRAEIMKLDDINPDYPMDRTIHISRNEVLQIIDKYKAESED